MSGMQDDLMCTVRALHLHRCIHLPVLRCEILYANCELPMCISLHRSVWSLGDAHRRVPLPVPRGA